jgi:hypothetical protein
MFKLRNTAIALLCAASVIGTSEFSSAELLTGQERETFVADKAAFRAVLRLRSQRCGRSHSEGRCD